MVRLAIVGAGGVGGYLGARLVEVGVEAHLVARGGHLAAIRRTGLRVRSPRGDLHVRPSATSNPADIGVVDFVIVAVKSYDTVSAAGMLHPLVGAETVVVSAQNGIDNEEKLAAVLGPAHVAGGVAFLFAELAAPGLIEHRGGPDRVLVGELDGSTRTRLQPLVDVLATAGLTAELSPDIRTELWSKFVFICAQAGTTAASRQPIGRIRSDPAAWAVFQELALEVIAVARAEGVGLPYDLRARIAKLASGLAPSSRSSLHDDLVAGRRLELEALHGEVRRRAGAAGVAVPTTATVYGLLHPYLDGEA